MTLVDIGFGSMDSNGFLHTSVATYKQVSADKKDEQSRTEGDTDHNFQFLRPG